MHSAAACLSMAKIKPEQFTAVTPPDTTTWLKLKNRRSDRVAADPELPTKSEEDEASRRLVFGGAAVHRMHVLQRFVRFLGMVASDSDKLSEVLLCAAEAETAVADADDDASDSVDTKKSTKYDVVCTARPGWLCGA